MAPLKNALKKSVSFAENLLNREQTSIGWATIEMMILLLLTKILGLAKMGIMAGRFGAGRELDIFYIANTIPELIFNIIAVGSINAALIPVYAKCIANEGESSGLALFQKVINIAIIAFVAISGLMFIFAPSMIDLSLKVNVGGVSSVFSEYDRAAAASMMRIMLISPILLGVSSIISAYLLVKRRYFVTRIAPLLYNIGVIIGILVFVPLTGGSILGLAFGIVLASILHLVAQIPTLTHVVDFSRVQQVILPKKYLKDIGSLAAPRLLTVASSQIGVVIRNVIALNLVPGSLTAYQFARVIFSIAVDLFGSTTAEAVFPTLSKLGAEGRRAEFSKMFRKALQQILFLTIPVSVLVFILRVPIVRFIFGLMGSGFDWQDTVMTSWTLFFLGFLVIVQAMTSLLLRGFYSLEDTITPLIVTTIALILNIPASIYLVKFFSNFNTYSIFQPYADLGWDTIKTYFTTAGGSPVAVGGLAAAGVLVWTLETTTLSILLNRKLRFLNRQTFWAVSKKAISGVIMGIGLYSSFRLFDRFLDTNRVFPLFIVMAVASVVGISLYMLSEYVFNDSDIEIAILLWRKFKSFVKSILGRT